MSPGKGEATVVTGDMASSARALSRRIVLAGMGLAATGRQWPARARTPEVRALRATTGGYDGAAPGPLLRVKRGEDLAVRLVNELAEPTALHWHGVRLPNAAGGMAHLGDAPVAPGAS